MFRTLTLGFGQVKFMDIVFFWWLAFFVMENYFYISFSKLGPITWDFIILSGVACYLFSMNINCLTLFTKKKKVA